MAQLDQMYVNSVVAIGVDKSGVPGSREWVGTGFLVTELIKGDSGNIIRETDGSSRFNVFLVTNKHVFEDEKVVFEDNDREKDMPSVIVRFRTKITRFCAKKYKQTIEYNLPLVDRETPPRQRWVGHTDHNIDVAAIGLVAEQLKEDGWQYDSFPCTNDITSDDGFMTIKQMDDKKVAEGEDSSVYIPGYPTGLVYPDWTDVTISHGHITQIQGALKGYNPSFVIAAPIIAGSSGSPVILVRYISATTIRGNIIGIVYDGEPDRLNARLMRVFPSDRILQTIKECNEKRDFVPVTRFTSKTAIQQTNA